MKEIKTLLHVLFLFSLCFLSACKLTEEQIRSLPPNLMDQNLPAKIAASEPAPNPAPKQLPFKLIFVGLALLVGAVLYLKSDDKPPLRVRVAPRRRAKRVSSRRSTKRKKS